ncbi:MAG: non-canonical purine NTP pyrophosphatase [Candidatus Limnocylindria bacterium]
MTGRLLIATTNVGKQNEFRRLLSALRADVVTPQGIGLALEVEEPHDTYDENAIVKADAFCRASGLLTLADDSGLEVAALDWGPGVRTGRWGAHDGRDAQRMVEAVSGADDRRARMVCALAIGIPGLNPGAEPAVELFGGVIDGSVADRPRGEGGFGYDPVFLLPSGVTTAELPEAEKDRISHRGQAVAAAMPRLLELLELGAAE